MGITTPLRRKAAVRQKDKCAVICRFFRGHISDVLDVVAGRAPLIVEYKFSNNRAWDERSEELMEKGHALLEAYDGPYVIESFHPGAVNWYKEHHPEVCRGQLSWPAKLSKNGAAEWAAGLLAFDWLSRPDFVAYDWTGGASPQVKLARSMGAMPVSWTVRSSDELAQCARSTQAAACLLRQADDRTGR